MLPFFNNNGQSMRWIITGLIVVTASSYQLAGMAQESYLEEPDKVFSSVEVHPLTTHEYLPNIQISQTSNSEQFIPLHRRREETELFQPNKLPFVPPTDEDEKKPYKASPTITVITPSAYGADWGNVGLGVGYQERTRFGDIDDGVIGIGFGLGDRQKNVGLQVGIGLSDVSDLFEDGSISLKLHRQLPSDFNVALGVQGIATWGNTDGGSSLFGVVTKRFPLKENQSEPFSEIYTSLGIGGGQFRPESDINSGDETIGVFGAIAVRVLEPMSAIAEWTGQDLTIALSLVPLRNVPLVIVPAITDVTSTAGDGTRFILGAGYSFSF